MTIFIIRKGETRVQKPNDLPKVMQLGWKVTALVQLSDPLVYLSDGCLHLLTLLGHSEGTLRWMV